MAGLYQQRNTKSAKEHKATRGRGRGTKGQSEKKRLSLCPFAPSFALFVFPVQNSLSTTPIGKYYSVTRRRSVKTWLRSVTAVLITIIVFAAPGGVVLAHHGRAGYGNEITTVKGVVTGVEWKNPHVFLNFDVTDDKGKAAHWIGELSSTSTMLAAGMSRTTLKSGDEIVVKGKAGKAENPVILIDSIVKDGKPVVGDPNAEGRFINDTR
jgi:hypothetical protein